MKGFQIPHLKKKKKNRVRLGHPGSGSTRRVARVWPGYCHSRSFIKPGPVQPPGWPGLGSTRRAGPGLITVVYSIQYIWISFTMIFNPLRIILTHYISCMRSFQDNYPICFCVSKLFSKNFKFCYFFFKLILFSIFRLFWCADVKNNFLKIKKILFWCIFEWKTL